jgi:superfamily II DNA helicase RecQ
MKVRKQILFVWTYAVATLRSNNLYNNLIEVVYYLCETCCARMMQVLFVSPERFLNSEFLSVFDDDLTTSLVVIDEAHCISEW